MTASGAEEGFDYLKWRGGPGHKMPGVFSLSPLQAIGWVKENRHE